MSGDTPVHQPHQRSWRSWRIAAIVVLALLAVGIPAFVAIWSRQSSASFADAEVLGTNHLGAATLELQVTASSGRDPSSGDGDRTTDQAPGATVNGTTEAVFTADNLAPGDSVSGWLEIANSGDLGFRIGLFAVGDGNPLGDWLRYEVWIGGPTCGPDGPGRRLARDISMGAGSTVLIPMTGDPSNPGPTLEAGQSMVLCLGATLPLAAPNEVQGQSTEVTLTVTAEQLPEVER